jgi:hypothetical protein
MYMSAAQQEDRMKLHARIWVLALLTGVLFAGVATSANAAGRIQSFFAANCKVETCAKPAKESEELEKAETEGESQAGAHPKAGVTDFTVANFEPDPKGAFDKGVVAPLGVLSHIRTDVAPGVSTNPEATVKKCTTAQLGKELAGTGFYEKTECPAESLIGENKAVVYAGLPEQGGAGDLKLSGNVYNLVQPEGLTSLSGVALELPKPFTEAILSKTPYKGIKAIVEGQYYAHTLIEGNVEWGIEPNGTEKADYHDFFEIKVGTALPTVSSRLIFKGQVGSEATGRFISNPTSCTGTGPQTTTKLKLEFTEGPPSTETYKTPIGTSGCGLVPFAPAFALQQSTTAPDQPDGITTEFSEPHNGEEKGLDSAQVNNAVVTLPPGLTLNPSAANGLEACTPEQFGYAPDGRATTNPVNCPEGSELGTVSLNVPGLPNGSLTGKAFLGGPSSGPITGPPYTMFVSAESKYYHVIVRLKGEAVPNETTGQLTATFAHNPEQPFSNLTVHLKGGPLAPLANGVQCEASTATTTFSPFTNEAAVSPTANFEVTGCAATIPFALSQSTSYENGNAGGNTSYSFTITRGDGQQYLQKIKTTLPQGLVGVIPAVTLCQEPQAAAGTCSSASRVGTATVTAGSGRIPYTFTGPVYMTGPYNGAPFGLSIAVPAVAGPFNLGTVVTRSTINIDPTTAQVTAESTLPTIIKGVPMRLRSVNVNINKQGFLLNPTSCSSLATVSAVTSTLGTVQEGLSSPLQLANCGALGFKPSFKAVTSGKTSRLNGASLETTITQGAGQANIKSVEVTLPTQLVSRQHTNEKACLPQVFAANPSNCPQESLVGSAKAVTPTLPGTMSGPAYLVARGGAQFPDLDLVLDGSGVRIILKGHTFIHNNRTITDFESTPDVPVSSITVKLPTQPYSALAPNGNLCTTPLIMPTVITGWNGVVVKQNTALTVKDCGVQITGHKVVGKTAFLTVQTFAAGRITGSGAGVGTVSRNFGSPQRAVSLKLRKHHGHGKVTLKVSFKPKAKGLPSSTASVTVRY